MCKWHRKGVEVLVTLVRGDDDALWDALQTRLVGVASVESDTTTRVRRLSLVEAYYAIAEEYLLAVNESLEALWCDFASVSPSFPFVYVVYYHFRRLGWFLRSGLNYGAPFVLYRGDADAFHSEYIVYLAANDTTTSWHAIQARTRVAEDVKKTVVICEVNVDDTAMIEEALPLTEGTVMETHGHYKIHGVVYTLDAVLIRYWDTATVDEDRTSYAFNPQPILLKKSKRTTKKIKEKRPRDST